MVTMFLRRVSFDAAANLPAIRCILKTLVILAIAVSSSVDAADTSSPISSRPLTMAIWNAYRARILAASARGEFATAETICTEVHSRCSAALGPTHPCTAVIAAHIRLYRSLQQADEQTRSRFADNSSLLTRVRLEGGELARATLPDFDSVSQVLTKARKASASIPLMMPMATVYASDCDMNIALAYSRVRMFGLAEMHAKSAHVGYLAPEGVETHTKPLESALSAILSELQKEPARQVALLEQFMDFAERHQAGGVLEWWKERAMTQLAETYYRQGKHEEADRLYAEVRSRLPEDSDHDVVGWCKSWCDRHEARRLMEKGDWDAAYEKIFQARVGTIDYGHRNLSKGLTMERILRMSAEIQRKRGNSKEADEDEEYADLIARHAAKLRTAVEAELRKLNQPEANTTPQPLPAPSP